MMKKMRYLALLIIILSLRITSCLAQQPDWVGSLVIDPEYYTGISSCDKSIPDYQSMATKRALSLITEQIQVTITSSNESYTSENDLKLSQDFFESVKTTSSIKLQDYELYQTWEDSSTYYVYYRLSKQIYRDNLISEYDLALGNCEKKIADAEAYLSSKKIDESISSYLEASKFLEEVISNTFIHDKYSSVVNQWYKVKSQLLKILFDFRVQPVNEKYRLSKNKIFSTDFEVIALYDANGDGVILPDIPVIFELSDNLNAFQSKVINTDNKGIARNNIINIYDESLTYTIGCNIDFARYLNRHGDFQILKDKEFENLLTNCKMLLEVIPLVVKITSVENTFSEKNPSQVIKNELGNYFRTQNISVVEGDAKCDYIVNIKADTRKGNVYEDVCSVFLDIEYSVYDNSNHSQVFNGTVNNIKGISLNYTAAANQAYVNARSDIKSKLGSVILPYLK